jgi:hypothetical protein
METEDCSEGGVYVVLRLAIDRRDDVELGCDEVATSCTTLSIGEFGPIWDFTNSAARFRTSTAESVSASDCIESINDLT